MKCISPVFVRKIFQSVPCGKCNFCLQARRLDWCFRLQQEKKNSVTSNFLTLTYETDYLPYEYTTGEASLSKRDLQKFFKRLRKFNQKVRGFKGRSIRYYAVGEYGTEKERPHYHVIVFNVERETINRIHEVWPVGHVDVGRVTNASIGYVTGYLIDGFKDYGFRARPFSVMSRRPGIGSTYLQSNTNWHRPANYHSYTQALNRFHVIDNGIKRRMPRYYSKKIFTTGDRDHYNALNRAREVKEYQEEIERLKPHAIDPHAYYDELRRHAHEQIARQVSKYKKHTV